MAEKTTNTTSVQTTNRCKATNTTSVFTTPRCRTMAGKTTNTTSVETTNRCKATNTTSVQNTNRCKATNSTSVQSTNRCKALVVGNLPHHRTQSHFAMSRNAISLGHVYATSAASNVCHVQRVSTYQTLYLLLYFIKLWLFWT